jgi:hypothetical protein
MEYSNENSGVLFKNDKATNEKAPQYTGKINVNGTDYRLAAWIKEGKKGKFMSLKVSELNDSAPAKPKVQQAGFEDISDDVPF